MVCNFYTTNNDIHEGTVTAHQILLQTAGKPALKAHKMFKQTLTVHEKPRLPRPSTCRTDEDVEKVIRIFTRSISKQLMISAAWHGAWKTGSFNRRICQAWLQWLYRNFYLRTAWHWSSIQPYFPKISCSQKWKFSSWATFWQHWGNLSTNTGGKATSQK